MIKKLKRLNKSSVLEKAFVSRLTSRILDVKRLSDSCGKISVQPHMQQMQLVLSGLKLLKCFHFTKRRWLPSSTDKSCLQDNRLCQIERFPYLNQTFPINGETIQRIVLVRNDQSTKKSVEKNVLDVDKFWNLKWWYGLEMTEWRKTCWKTAV